MNYITDFLNAVRSGFKRFLTDWRTRRTKRAKRDALPDPFDVPYQAYNSIQEAYNKSWAGASITKEKS